MNAFNPRILEACIRDVSVCLSDRQKADVLLHALQHLPAHSSRTVMENAVQSLLRVCGLPATDMTRALLLRAKSRLAAGYRTSAQHDLHSVLTMDPNNEDVKSIVQSQHLRPEMLLRDPEGPPRFSIEVWREIALFLPKRDLKSLLLVPHPLSRIASQLLFREINLHLVPLVESCGMNTHGGTGENVDQDLSDWHHQRSADILARILVDPQFSNQVRSLGIHATCPDATQPLAFQVGMILNALPKLSNLRKVHCSGSKELISRMLRCMNKFNPRIQLLSLQLADRGMDIDIPHFRHLTHFSLVSEGGNSSSAHVFLAQSRETLHALAVKNVYWHFPSDAISVRQLTQLEFSGHLSLEMFSEILSNGHQLESLMLSGPLECMPSALFRKHCSSLPFLRHFSLNITGLHRHISDRELCPAISEFLRPRTQLRTYRFFITCGDYRRFGFDASAWGVLPAMTNLRSLSITYPSDLSSTLAGWLVPRSVRALTLDLAALKEDVMTFMNQIRNGIPPSLKYVGITSVPICSALNVVETGFPQVRVIAIEHNVWNVTRTEEGTVQVEQWPCRRARYHALDWLELMECGEAMWRGVDEL